MYMNTDNLTKDLENLKESFKKPTEQQSSGMRAYFGKIYSKMALGVLITTLAALFMAFTSIGNQWFSGILQSQVLWYGFIAIELVLVFGIQWGINKLSESMAKWLFFLYALVNGITLSVIFYAYAGSLILSSFIGALVIFIVLATIGKRMKYDMSGWKTFLFAGMWGVFFTSLINIFLASSTLDWILTIAAVLVFAGLTVYDAQFYKNLYLQTNTEEHNTPQFKKIIIIGALHMYINFIMIFTNLLRILGGRD